MTNPWLPWWSPFPDLTKLMQTIAPQTSWFSPTYEVNFAGNREIETDIVANVASYGTQLGALIKAMLEIGKKDDGPAMTWLRELAGQIEDRKRERKSATEEDLREKLEAIRASDPAMLQRLLQRYAKKG